MNVLNTLPLIGAILGVFLSILIFADKGSHGKNKKAKITLGVIVLLNVLILIDSFIYFSGIKDWEWSGFSYLYNHLIGALFLWYAYYLFKIKVNIKLWAIVLTAYTLLRWLIVIPIILEAYETEGLQDVGDIGFAIDYYISVLLNIVLLILAFQKIRNQNFSVELKKQERINYKWLKNLLIGAIVLYVFILIDSFLVLAGITGAELSLRLETTIVSAFFFAIAFFAIRFPVFAVYGDFEDLPEAEQKQRYAKSSLKGQESEQLWSNVMQLMEQDKLYRNPELRLNELAEKTGRSLHHVSQVINENKHISFSDFVNEYRVDEAKELLLSPRASEITIFAISLEVGFNSKTAFYNAFKKITGKTPSQFKKEQK